MLLNSCCREDSKQNEHDYVPLYVCIVFLCNYICVNVCAYLSLYVFLHLCICQCESMHLCMCSCEYVYVCINVCRLCIYVCDYLCIYICVQILYMCLCTYIFVCICVYVPMYLSIYVSTLVCIANIYSKCNMHSSYAFPWLEIQKMSIGSLEEENIREKGRKNCFSRFCALSNMREGGGELKPRYFQKQGRYHKKLMTSLLCFFN